MATTDTTHETSLDQLNDLIKGFDDAMLVSTSTADQLHGRPMRIAGFDNSKNLWFFTASQCVKTTEINAHHAVCVTMQRDKTFISLTGRAVLSQDKHLMRSLWNDKLLAWFPQGVEQENLGLIKVDTQWAEYWDYSGMGKNLRFNVSALNAAIHGDPGPSMTEYGAHAKVGLTKAEGSSFGSGTAVRPK